ncbi:MAG: hypothetical protein ABEJ07_02575 [Candidatus Nanohaloarchaea archaeon]
MNSQRKLFQGITYFGYFTEGEDIRSSVEDASIGSVDRSDFSLVGALKYMCCDDDAYRVEVFPYRARV